MPFRDPPVFSNYSSGPSAEYTGIPLKAAADTSRRHSTSPDSETSISAVSSGSE